MPATSSDYSQVTAKRKEAAAKAEQAGELTAGSRTFEDRVMEGVREARATRGASTLETAIGTTTGQLATAPAEMRARLTEVNPLDVDVLTARQTGQTLSTLATLGEVQRAREGTIQEVIGAGTNTLLARADLLRAQAERAANEAEAIMQQLKYEEDLRARQDEERRAQAYLDIAQQELELERTKVARSGAAAPGGIGSRDYVEDVIGLKNEASLSDDDRVRNLMYLYPGLSESQARQDLGLPPLAPEGAGGGGGTFGLKEIGGALSGAYSAGRWTTPVGVGPYTTQQIAGGLGQVGSNIKELGTQLGRNITSNLGQLFGR